MVGHLDRRYSGWIVAILACFVFIASSESGLVDGMCLIGLGALLVWQLSRRQT